MNTNQLTELFTAELKKTRDAENQLADALPKIVTAASSPLRELLQDHLEQTKDHAARLDMILQVVGETSDRETCRVMQAMIKETEEIVAQKLAANVLPASLIAHLQKIEHYEIASYGTLRGYATALQQRDTAAQLQATLEEEQEAGRKLTILAQVVNAEIARDESSKKEEPLEAKLTDESSPSTPRRAA